MPSTTRTSELIRRYAEGPRLLEEGVAGILDDELRFTPGPEHWTIHENVVHVADAELVWAARMRYVLAQPGAALVGFDQNRWAKVLDYSSLSLATSLALFRSVREITAEMLRHAPSEAWEHAGQNTGSGPQTLEWIVEHLGGHVDYHLRTIAKRRRQYMEARRSSEQQPS